MLVLLSIWLLRRHPEVVPQEGIMLMGLEALEGMVSTVHAAPTNMSNAEMQMVHNGLKRRVRAMGLLDTGQVPNHH